MCAQYRFWQTAETTFGIKQVRHGTVRDGMEGSTRLLKAIRAT